MKPSDILGLYFSTGVAVDIAYYCTLPASCRQCAHYGWFPWEAYKRPQRSDESQVCTHSAVYSFDKNDLICSTHRLLSMQ